MKESKPLKISVVIIIDILVFAVALLTFAYFHHVRLSFAVGADDDGDATYGTVERPTTKPPITTTVTDPVVDPVIVTDKDGKTVTDEDGRTVTEPVIITDTTTADDIVVPVTPTYDTSGDFGQKFGELFSADDTVYSDESTYRSHDIYIKKEYFEGKLKQKKKPSADSASNYQVSYYLYDVYIRNVDNFITGYSSKGVKKFETLAGDAILSITGDNYKNSSFPKYVIRNGNILMDIPKTSSHDICVLYWDGVMETYQPGAYKWDDIMARGPYQVWTFGPELIAAGGQIPTSYNTSVWTFNPRSAIGYVEPGHYIFFVADGRSNNGSAGINLSALSEIFAEHGCVSAYNLDGGASAQSVFLGEWKYHSNKYRSIYDVVSIVEVEK